MAMASTIKNWQDDPWLIALSPQFRKLSHRLRDSRWPPFRVLSRVPKDGIKLIFNYCYFSLFLGTPNGYPEINPLLSLFPHAIRGQMAELHRPETHGGCQGQIQMLVWIIFLDFVMFVVFASFLKFWD